ncbi:hypothetical protein AVEN_115338-1 [Araneus ventricosus]|uniref:Uncharacterized protein n=1 Tax=Araneus ventricosus TaxID=182803 RepID=A0A4Y1ZY37_ARAVE|nr:hypothetical protein AVEN_115338-1 [Araneus ventricosus]
MVIFNPSHNVKNDTEHLPPGSVHEAHCQENGQGPQTNYYPAIATSTLASQTSSLEMSYPASFGSEGTLCRNSHVPVVITLCEAPNLGATPKGYNTLPSSDKDNAEFIGPFTITHYALRIPRI